jgi:DNA polymerase
MFNVPIDMVTKGSDLRAKGKVATLALGYQGAVGALIQMGALREGLQESELPAIVHGWRMANPKIVKLWRRLEEATRHVISRKTRYTVKGPYCDITYRYEKGYLFCELPGGRRLAYYGAHMDGTRIRYWGLDQVKKIWVKMDAYGGLLAENVTQAIARDCLYDAMYRMRDIDILAILMHIHDEIVGEADDDKAALALEEMENVMRVSPTWAEGLPLKGDGYISKFYKKD